MATAKNPKPSMAQIDALIANLTAGDSVFKHLSKNTANIDIPQIKLEGDFSGNSGGSGHKKKSMWGVIKGAGGDVLEGISRGLYGVGEGISRAEETFAQKQHEDNSTLATYKHDITSIPSFFPGFIEGVTGKKKTTGSEVLQRTADAVKATQEQEGSGKPLEITPGAAKLNNWEKYGIGLPLSVALDPLTYAGGVGALKEGVQAGKLAKTTQEAVDAAKVAQEAGKTVGKIPVDLQVASHAGPVDAGIGALRPVGSAVPSSTPMDTFLNNIQKNADVNLATGNKLGDALDNASHELPKLPAHLAGAKPRFNFGNKIYHPEFTDDVSKALYIVGGRGTSKSHDLYMGFLRNHFAGMSDTEIRNLGRSVSASVKAQAATAEPGRLVVDTSYLFTKGAKAAEKAAAETAAEVAPAAAPIVEAATPVAEVAKEVAAPAQDAATVIKETAAKSGKVKAYKSPHIKLREGAKPGSLNPADYMITKSKLNQFREIVTREEAKAAQAVAQSVAQSTGKTAAAIAAANVQADKSVLDAAKKIFDAAKKAKDPSIEGLVWADVKKDPVLRKVFTDQVPKSVASTSKLPSATPVANAFDKQKRYNEIRDAFVKQELAKEAKGQATKVAAATKKIAETKHAVETAAEVGAHPVAKAADLARAAEVAQAYAEKGYKFVSRGANGKGPRYAFNPAKQRNLFTEVRKAILDPRGGFKKVGMSRSVNREVIAAYSHALDELARIVGKAPGDYVGNPFRLDHVLTALVDKVPPGELLTDAFVANLTKAMSKAALAGQSPEIQAAIAAGKKVATVDDATKVAPIITEAESHVQTALDNLDEVAQAKVRQELPQAAANEANAAGAAASTVDSVKETVRQIVQDIPANPAYVAAKAVETRAYQTYLTGTITPAMVVDLKGVTDASIKQLGLIRSQRDVKDWLLTTEKGVDKLNSIADSFPSSLSILFNNAHGMANIHTALRMAESSAEGYAESRLKLMRGLLNMPELNTVEKQVDAWNHMASELRAGHAGATALADHLGKYLGAKESLMANLGMTLEELNPFLRNQLRGDYFQFGKEFKDSLGVTHKATGANVLDHVASWNPGKLVNSKNPVGEMLYSLEVSVEQAMAHAMAMSHLSSVLGTTEKVRGFVEVAHPRLKGVYFPPEIAPQINKHLELLNKMSQPGKVRSDVEKIMATGLDYYDAGLRAWKKGVTQYSPAHHARNLMGDMFLSYLAGVTNPKRYLDARRVLESRRAIENSAEFYAHPKLASLQGKTIIRHPKFGNVSDTQLWHAFTKYGGRQATSFTEEFSTGVKSGRSILRGRPFAGKVDQTVRQMSETREDFGRMAHFIDALSKSKAANLDEAARQAMEEVRKFHFDYGDLTDFERKVMKRLIPFYTWTRKSTPLLIEQFFQQPWKFAVLPKVNFTIAGLTGQDPQSLSEPWPQSSNALFPEWMKNTMGAQWFTHNGNPVQGKIPDPFTDMMNQNTQNPLSQLSPFIKDPLELAFGKQTLGIPITDKTRYLDSQIPGVSNVGRLTNTSPGFGALESLLSNPKPGTGFARTTDPANPGGGAGPNMAAILSQLLGLGFNEATKSRQKSAEFERKGSRP